MERYPDFLNDTQTPHGTAAVWWLGQMGLLIKMNQTVLCIDYYAAPGGKRNIEPPVPAREMRGIDAFFGTHDHIDHIDHESWKIWAVTQPQAKFVFPGAQMESVLADGVAARNAVGINDGESIQIGDVTVHAVAASHEFLDQDPMTGQYPYLQYIIEGNGVRIHHAGDTVRYEGMMPRIKSFGKIDLQLLPINGRDAVRYRRKCIGNMTYQEAADFAGEIGANMVIPGHWDMFPDNSADPEAFAEYLDVKYEGKVKCQIPGVMETVMIHSKEADE